MHVCVCVGAPSGKHSCTQGRSVSNPDALPDLRETRVVAFAKTSDAALGGDTHTASAHQHPGSEYK